jgi:hypothetical protein
MSGNSIQAVQTVMLQLMNNNSETKTNASEFSSMLSAQMLSSLGGGAESSDSTGGFSGLSSNMTSLLLLSLLLGNSGPAMSSLGSASSGAKLTPSTALYQAASSAYGVQSNYTGTATPVAASKPCTPAITSNESNRSAALYRQVIDQFQVETNPRYAVNKKGHGDTYCNIFMWDVTSAMGAEIPHYVDAETGAPRTYPDVKGAREMSANSIYKWLHEHGSNYGWFEVTPEQAQALANQGRPVVTAFKKTGHGHVQVVCPSKDGQYNKERGVTIAQAGRNLTSYRPITSIYNASLPKVKYFAHA